jgi:hypothetical protein
MLLGYRMFVITSYLYTCHEYELYPSAHIEPETASDKYHTLSLDVRGIKADCNRLYCDVTSNSTDLKTSDRRKLKKHYQSGSPKTSYCDPSANPLQAVISGYFYKSVSRNFHYARGWYFAAAKSPLGVVSGRSVDLDDHVKHNFGQVTNPTTTDHTQTYQQGVLLIDTRINAKWSLAYNDTFYIGAHQFGRSVYLCSQRLASNILNDQGFLTVFAREILVFMMSGSYEMHISALGEVLIPIVGERSAKWDIATMMHSLRRLMDSNQSIVELLTHQQDMMHHLSKNDVIVQKWYLQ